MWRTRGHRPIYAQLAGGGQEFQEQSPWDNLPNELYVGPPPPTQSMIGPGGVAIIPTSPIADLALPAFSQGSPTVLTKYGGKGDWRYDLLRALQQKGDFQQSAGTVGTNAVLIRKAESRTYLIIQNTSTANLLFVAFGYAPQVIAGGATGFQLNSNGGNYEPKIVPQQDMWVIANAAATPWVMAVVVD